MNNRWRPWSDLPPELLTLITRRLHNSICILRFRAVCHNWRECCPLSSPRSSSNNNNCYKSSILSPLFPQEISIHSFTANTVFLIEPLKGNLSIPEPRCWMIFVDEFLPGRLAFRYPLSKYRVRNYPENFSYKSINLLDFRVTEVAKSYCYNATCSWRWLDLIHYWNKDVDKVILLPEHDMMFCDNEFKSAVVRRNGHLEIYCSKGNKWNSIDLRVDDVVNYKGRIFAFDRKRRTYAIDYKTFEIVQVGDFVFVPAPKRKRLVVSDKGLYLVVMDHRKDDVVCLRAYKLNEEVGRWAAVTSLDDQVFFVGSDCSFSFSAQKNPGFQANCIYAFRSSFLHGSETDYQLRGPHPSMVGIFNLGVDGSFGPLDTCDLFWPAPFWVAPSYCASRNSGMNQRSTLKRVSQLRYRETDDASKALGNSNGSLDIASANDNLQNVASVEDLVTDIFVGDLDIIPGINKEVVIASDDEHQNVGASSMQLENTGHDDLQEDAGCSNQTKVTSDHDIEAVAGIDKQRASGSEFIKFYPSLTISEGKAIAPSEPTIKQCMDILKKVPGMTPGSSIWNYSCNLLCKKELRTVFVNQPTNELRQSWLKFNYSLFSGRYPEFKEQDTCENSV